MNETQRIVKYIAMAFAAFLAFIILSSIIFGLIMLNNIFSNKNNIDDLKIVNVNDFTNLELDIGSTNLIIKEGTKLKIETNSNLDFKQNGNKLTIEEKFFNFINIKSKDLIIYVPNNYTFDNILLETGFGKVEIEKLNTNFLDLNLGFGRVNINNLNVLTKTIIEGGAGEISINSSNLNNLDLDMGLGKVSLNTRLSGSNEINAGIGNLDINLIGEDYKIKIDKGIGTATIDGKKINEYGTGLNLIDVDGGIGSIKIELKK